jgi:N12 class adenine-specific DNA methylase
VWRAEREELRALVGDEGYAAARRTTLNAHYTHPELAQAMWDLAAGLGFAGGRAIEPGCGAGVFIGLAPETAEMVGVELDETTAQIAQELYPHARVINRSFADSSRTLRPGSFDLAIGNVPFGKVTLYDPEHNRGGHAIHNHFIVKSLALTRPGGLAVLLTSRYTLDAANPAARREMSELADLIGAIRLPSGAQRRVAGTEAITDLLVFRRRQPGAEPVEEAWVRTEEVDVDGGRARISSYLAARPEQVLGKLKLSRGLYGEDELVVERHAEMEDLAAEIRAWGERGAVRQPAAAAEVAPAVIESARPVVEAPEGLWDGHLLALPSGAFAQVQDGLEAPIEPPRTIRAELRALLGLRDGARALLTAEARSLHDTPAIDTARTRLRDDYEQYAKRFGAINRFSERRTGRADPKTGEERMARVTPPAVRALRSDPFAALVLSLELFDEETRRATPAALLRQRVVAPRAPILGVETPQDALAICLDTRGHVDLAEIATLLGMAELDARRALGELVYDTPAGELLPAADYLSGNVREKLVQAREAAVERPELEVNVAALERVLPVDLGVDEVHPQLGAAWIDVEDHRAFLAEILDDSTIEVESAGGGVWGVKGNNASLLARSEWGTERIRAPAIVKALLEQRPVQVTDEIDDGRRVINPVDTAAAQEKAQALRDRFAEWCWADPERADRLLREYNHRFNSIVLRDYTTDGERLSLPGLVRTFTPMPHQRAAVARIISEPAVGLFHQVGAGKTAEMIIGATELRRLGMVRKPVIVVPNHMLEQFTREWLQLYPQSRVLATSAEDLAGERRRQFVARAASNDWDGVLMTRSAFERIPVSIETQKRYLEREVAELREMLSTARGLKGGSLTVKRLEKMVLSAEEQLKRRLDTVKDPGISFEETGIDYIVVDEAHGYKNLRTVSNIRDAAIDGSGRATDLHMKVTWLRERHGRRVVTMATATPIANSVTEAHVMQRYLRPDLLRDAGVEHFDQWAATFGQTVTEIEMAPTGGGNYRLQTRFARFANVPEMLRMWHVFADVKTGKDLKLPTPQLKPTCDENGNEKTGPRTVVIPAGPEITSYLHELAARAEKVRARSVSPDEDNMLKISTDGRKAALDMRLVTGERVRGVCKLERAASTIAGVWRATRELAYADPDSGEPSSIPGALQLVFCDLSTPNDTWNAYDELRTLLAGEGVPDDQVRFIHEARNDAEKGRLFASCRAGHVSVLVGSTEKMGVGTNIQSRAIALHHLDCPWRPADIEQREGRILRQGNQNSEVAIYRYVVERSFDAYSWQTVERKAKFINQVTRGRLDARTVDDVGDSTLSYTEVKALASGDPLILEHARASQELIRLERLERAWGRNQQNLRHVLTGAGERGKARIGEVELLDWALARRCDTRGEKFAFTIGTVTFTERRAAADALARWAAAATQGVAKPVGSLAGLDVVGTIRLDYTDGSREAMITLTGVPCEPARASLKHLGENPIGLVRQLEHRIQDLDRLRARTVAKQQEAAQEAARAREALGRPFKHADNLRSARQQLHQIIERMQTASHHATGDQDVSRAAAAATQDTSPRRDPRDASHGTATDTSCPPRPRPPALSPSVPEPQAARHLGHRASQWPGRGVER